MLLLMLCSTVENTCYKPVHYPDLFDDNYTCLIKGYNESIKQIQDIGYLIWIVPRQAFDLIKLLISSKLKN
mgnify:CR=1 FL=1